MTFEIDILACPDYGGRLCLLATIELIACLIFVMLALFGGALRWWRRPADCRFRDVGCVRQQGIDRL